MKNEIEEIVFHKDQMSFDFNWEEIDDDLIQREATLAVECGDYDNWDHAYETLWDLREDEETRDLVLTQPF
jgi:hypothetical protein